MALLREVSEASAGRMWGGGGGGADFPRRGKLEIITINGNHGDNQNSTFLKQPLSYFIFIHILLDKVDSSVDRMRIESYYNY